MRNFVASDFHLIISVRYKPGFQLNGLASGVSERFLSLEKADMVETFFKENPMPGTERAVAQAVETVRLNAAWLTRDRAALHQYLTRSQ